MEFVWVDLQYQPEGADVWVSFEGSGVLQCYLIPSPQFNAFAKGDAVDCFQFDVAPPEHAVQIPSDGSWHVVMRGTGVAEVRVSQPAILTDNVRAILQPEKHQDPTPDPGVPDLTELPLRSGTGPAASNPPLPSGQPGWENLLVPPVGLPGPKPLPSPSEQLINEINAPPPPSERFSTAERYLFREIEKNRRSRVVNDMAADMTPPISALDASVGLYELYTKVKAHAEWDHKHKIEVLLGIDTPDKLDDKHYLQQPGTNRRVYYDIWSNIHFGYIGRVAKIPTDVLIFFAELGTADTGQNDDGDEITMRGGAALYDRYGPNMTTEQFEAGVLDIINQLDAAKQAGESVPQIRYLP
jgi:hypothetical protein